MHLWCVFYLSQPVFDRAQLEALQAAVNVVLPEWSKGLAVARDEDSEDLVAVGRDDRLYDCAHRVAPPKRGLGDAVLTGADGGVSFFLQSSDKTLPPELNEVTMEVYGLQSVEGQPVSVWARQAFEVMVTQLPVRYANAHVDDEFAAKNLLRDETRAEAICGNLEDSLPGLYWLNYFGEPYMELMGRGRLLTAPAYEVKSVGEGVLIAVASSAETWETEAYRRREEAVIEHLGKQYFFSRHDPARTTVAPRFTVPRER